MDSGARTVETVEGYRSITRLGQSSVAALYSAVSAKTGEEVQLRLLRPHILASSSAVKQFERISPTGSGFQLYTLTFGS